MRAQAAQKAGRIYPGTYNEAELRKSIARAADRMAELADTLETAGYVNQAILNHCRQPGEHVRGCWVLELVLGKE